MADASLHRNIERNAIGGQDKQWFYAIVNRRHSNILAESQS